MSVPVRAMVGRSAACWLVIDDRSISAEHAAFAFRQGAWMVRDLASTNGTELNGEALAPGRRYSVQRGAVLRFGHQPDSWQLIDDAPPGPAAVRSSGQWVHASGPLLLLPSDEDPLAMLYATESGWEIDSGGDNRAVLDGEEVEIAGVRWRLALPTVEGDSVASTLTSSPAATGIDAIELRFRVSSDEEHVDIQLITPTAQFALPTRAWSYALLILARARKADGERGVPEPDRGWLYADQLATMLGCTAERLNVDVFRIRQLFSEHAIVDAARVVERRRTTRQLRIGVARLAIET